MQEYLNKATFKISILHPIMGWNLEVSSWWEHW